MYITTKKTRIERKRINRLRAQVQREINEHKFTFTPEVYKKTKREKNLLKKKKREYKDRLNAL